MHSPDIGGARTGHLSANNIMTRGRKRRRSTMHLRGDYMEEAWTLEDEEDVLLFNQQGVPKGEDRGVITQDTDRLMNIALPHGSQVAEAREETPRVEGRPPYRGSGHFVHRLTGWDRARRW